MREGSLGLTDGAPLACQEAPYSMACEGGPLICKWASLAC